MIDFKNDPTTWDLATYNGDLVLVDNADAIQQHLIQRLKLFRGEWFLDLDAGVPYFQDILVKNPNPVLVDGVLKDAILETPGVLELSSFSMTYDSTARTLVVAFQVETINGPVNVNTQLGA
jgi:hypothetical protein